MKDPYAVLGLDKNSDPDQLRARYEALKARYGEQRYQDGEVGNEGARLLSELETAWAQIERDLVNRQTTGEGGFGRIESLIKSGAYDEAQDILDSITDRNGKWHYYQSVIYYKREWLSESRAQLVIAIQLEPNNAKYKESLRKLDMVMGNPQTSSHSASQGSPYDENGNRTGSEFGGQRPPYGQQPPYGNQYRQDANDAANSCADCVMCYCLTELCCSSTRICCH